MYKIQFTKTALSQIKKLQAKDPTLSKRIEKALDSVGSNPNYIGLKTHRVITRKYGEHFSSRVTGNLRLFWNYSDNSVVAILAIEDHSAYK